MSFGFGFGFPRRAAAGGAAPSLNFDFTSLTSLPSRITFSRTSNATLTDSNGRVAYAPHNLLTNSEDFEASVWSKSGTTVTANTAVAPDGTTTADTLVFNTTGDAIFQQFSTTDPNRQFTFSCWLRVASATSAVLDIQQSGGASTSQVCNLTTAWQRFSVSYTTTGAPTFVRARILPNSNTPTVFAWGAQLNVANAPVNLLTFSEQFDNAVWLRSATTITSNSTVAPDGTTTADTIIGDGTSAIHSIRQGYSLTGARTFSFYAKAGTNNFVQTFTDGTSNEWANFNLSTGAVGSFGTETSNVTITDVGSGWYRCNATFAVSNSTTHVRICLVTSATAARAETNTLSTFVFLWGAQLNTGSTALPYVATTSSIYLPPSYNSTTPKNLLGFTQEFDNAAWTKTNSTVSANVTAAPDGYATADKLIVNAATTGGRVSQSFTLIAAPTTLSVYAKAGEWDWVVLSEGAPGARPTAWFNLTTGAVGTSDPSATPNIASLGNGWYRCSITFVAAGVSSTYRVTATNADNAQSTGDGTSGIYIWGAQLSNSASVDPYVYNPQAAPTSTAYYGPRFDYNPTTLAANGLLVEEQRSNLLTYSEDFSNAAWSKLNTTVSANVTTAPDGATTADKLVENASNAEHYAAYSAGLMASTASYTLSVFAKASERSFLWLYTFDGTSAQRAWFNLATGAVGTVQAGSTAAITPFGNGWYRCSITRSITGNASANGGVGLSNTDNVTTYTGDGTSGIFIWGAQLEAGSFATSLIPTQASQVTRAADNASMLGDNFATWFNQVQGTIGVNFSFYSAIPASGNRGGVLALGPGGYAAANALNIFQDGGTQNLAAYFTSATYPDVNLIKSLNAAANATNKAAYAYNKSAGSYALTTNGQSPSTGTSTQNTATFNSMHIGVRNSGSTYLNGTIQSISFYPTALPPATLQSITA